MKRAWTTLWLIVATSAVATSAILTARGDYLTFDMASHEAMADYTRFESRSWAADAVGEGGRLERNTVWYGDEHVIVSDIYIPSGVTLTINAGTVVKFREGTRIKVEDGGSLVINGASGNEVVLEGYNDETVFTGIVLQSSAASYSDNGFVIVRGFNFGRYATVSLNNTTAFLGGGQALVPVDVSGSRDTAFSFDWVAETNGVTFASGTMSWNRVSDGRKNITVPYPDGLPGCSNFVIRAVTFRCCSPNASECVVTLSEFITTDIFCHEAMADYIAFESREWAVGMAGEGGRLATNATWSGTHTIVSDVYIPSGVTLTLTADTVVEFCEGTRIKIEDGGTLNIVGADGHDVILRGAEGVANFGGIVKMPSGTFTDNSYFRFEGFTYGTLANVALHDSSTFRSSGLALIPVTVSGSRSTAFSIDWVAETNGAPYKTGTLKWNGVSEGTKNISINYGAELDGYTNFTLRAAVDRACKTSPNTCTIKISDFIVSDIASHESMAEYIRFESRDWAADLEGEGGRLAANATWEGTHKIASDVYIPSGVTLTLAADAVVEFYEGTRIKIEDGGTLNIVGANGHDVIIRGAEGVTNYVGIVKMPNGTYTDNMYVQYTGKPYSAYPYITVHEATTYREAGKMWVAFSLSGTTRNQSFNVDWSTDKGDSGTLTWSSSSDGTKWIEIPVDSELVGGTTNHVINLTAARGCNISVGKSVLTILEPNYNVKGQVALAESDTQSNEFAVNGGIKTQPLFLNDVETVQYSGKWQPYDENEAAVLRVTLETDNGATVLKEASPSETGAFDLDLKQYPVGYYTLKHEILNDLGETLATMQKTFSIADDEDVVLHGGVLASNEVWAADKVHVVYETVVVPSIYTIFIEPGAIVKFMTGTGIDISQGGAFFANRIVFTHINDDTVGGDTLNDGFTVAPPMDAYYLAGAFTFGDDTELRGITQNNALTGTIATQKTLSRGSTYRVSGTLTIASGGSLTIPPGTVLKMEDKAAIVVNSGATLNAVGTRAAPITFTSIKDDTTSGDTNGDGSNTIPQPGDWEEIKNNGGTMNLAFVTALYGGYGQYANQGDAIIRTANGETKMDCCVVKHSNLRLVGRTGGTVYAENCILEDGRWGIDGAVTFVNGVIANCNTGANGATLKNSILWVCDTYASGGTASNCVAYGEIATVQTGMTYADPLFVDPVNGDFRVKEGSPCVDAADGAVAPELDFYGQPRITTTDHGDELVGQLADIGVCEVMPRDVVSDIDLVPQSVRTTTNAVPGQLLFVKWEIANVGGREVDAAWRDTVSLVSESGREVVLGVKTTSSRIGVGGSVFCSGYFTVPAISEGTWYPKVNVNSYHDIFEGSLAANNALTGERAVSVGLEALDPSISREGEIYGGTPTVLKLVFGEMDAKRMVKFDVPAGVKATWGFGFMPGGSRSVATASGFMTATSDGVMFRVPDGATDVYVILESDTTTTYNLLTESTQMTITSVTPATLPSSGTTTLTITGAGFGETNALSLISPVGRVALNAPQKDASGNLIATVDCATLTAGQTYDLAVISGDDSATLPGAVAVTKAEGKGILVLEYDVPPSVRPGRVFTFTVTYRNIGNTDMCVPLLSVQDTGNDAVNPIQFSLDGERFTSGGFQFVGNDAEGGFGPLHPGDVVTLLMTAKIPPANNGSTAVSVRANTESDIMAKYTTEIDRYLTPSMKAEFAATTDDELKARGERLAQVFGANNGEMVQNFATYARQFRECNGFVLQKVVDLVEYGMAQIQSDNNNGLSTASSKSGMQNLSAQLDSATGAYLYKDRGRQWILNKSNALLGWGDEMNLDGSFSLAGKKLALVSHGWNNSYHEAWVLDMADALSDTKLFDGIILVNWEKEASDYVLIENDSVLFPRLASGHIPAVANRVAGQLNDLGITPELCTFIGHSFGSHLNAQIARRLNGRLYRHIGLDTADDWGINDGIEIRGNEADFMEFYRSSHLAGYDAPYVGCGYNYIILDKNGFNRVAPLKNHSYSHKWFIENIKDVKGKNSGLGFWSDNGMPRNLTRLSSSGFAGVIYGPEHRLECTYRFGEIGFNYPGNRVTWEQMYHAWNDAVDLDIVDRGNVSLAPDSNLREGETVNVSFSIADNVDIETINRGGWPYKYHLTGVLVLEGKTPVTVVDADYDTRTFNIELKVPKVFTTEEMQEGSFVFSVSARKGERDVYSEFYRINYSDTTELYPPDNSATIPVVILRSDLPFADINGNVRNDFVLQHPEYFETQEEYDDAVQQGKTFTYVFDGGKSKPGKGKSIVGYRWTESSSATAALGNKVTLSRRYSATASACYPIMLTVENSQGEISTVKGSLQVEIRIGKGKHIEQPRSYDPNEMRGKIGLGDPETQRFVKPGEWMTYTIYFENKTNATAAAQEVYVTNPLSEWLDWSTFKMHEVAFGDQIDLGLVDKSSGTSEVTMKGTNFVVRTELVLEENGDAGTRDACPYQARWYMRIVDPTTDTGWPKDIVAGFLPPNDETHRGEGHITYSICVREDAPANLVISNSADIVFDHNPSIKTDPAWWNTVAPTTGNAKFNEAVVETEEGSNAVIRVAGGNLYTASSVKVYLTYNTAAAADVDLAKGTVDGVTPKGGLKFPLALSWEAGEIGEKVITIPTKTDKTVEDDEFFTLQLAEPVGMELGESSVCAVTIHDPGYDDLAAKVAAGTATKAELSAWDKLQKAKAPYVRGLADPANAGKVTGSGLCAAGKKVTLKATANKGFVFMGWSQGSGSWESASAEAAADKLGTGNGFVATTASLVVDRTAKPAKDTATSTTVTNVDDDVTYYADFITVDEDKAAVALTVDGAELRRVEDNAPYQTNVFAGVYLEWPVAASALSATAVKVTGLPSGLKFADKPVTSKVGTGKSAVTVTNVPANTIYGAPTTASTVDKKTGLPKPSDVKITVTTAGKSSVTYLVKLTVDPLPAWTVGSFEGSAGEGSATMSVTAAGKVSGKFALGGTNWTFKADSYAAFEFLGETTNFVVSAVATAGKATMPVELELSRLAVYDLPDSATACAAGLFGDADAVLYRLVWTDKGDADAAAYVASYAGAYSFVAAYGDTEGDVTFTLSEKGAIKGAAAFPDGAKTRKVTFAANALAEPDGLHVVFAVPADAKKGYPAVFEDRVLMPWSGVADDDFAYRDPGAVVGTEELNKGSGASGTVTVSPKYGQVAAGKTVTLTAKADKGSVFSCWEIEGVDTTGLDLSAATLKYVATGEGDVTAVAKFATVAEDKGSIRLELGGEELAGPSSVALVSLATNVMCGVALDWPLEASAHSATTVKVAGLPAGLKFDAKSNAISGAPTAAKTSDVKITVTTAGKSSVTYLVKLTVDPLPAWAVGSFEGPAGNGSATMSVTAAGKVSGKFSLGGTNWTFKADSYSAASETVGATNLVVTAVATAGKATMPVDLALSALALGYLPDSATACAAGLFGDAEATLYRLVWADKGDADAAAYVASYAGAYSFVAAYGDTEGDVTFTLSEKGTIKGAAAFPDGAKTRKVSFAANALAEEDGLHIVVAIPADAKKGYPAVFEDRVLMPWSGVADDDFAYRDPGAIVGTEELNKGSGASGTVTVSPKYGQVAAGKTVTLTAKADKGSVFSCWEIEGVDTTGLDLSAATLKYVATGEGDVTATAKFVTAAEDKESIKLSVNDGGWLDSSASPALATNVTCGVALNWQLEASAHSATTVKVAGLPAGLKFDAKSNAISGAPTAAKTSDVKITVTTAGKSSVTYLVKLTVDPLPDWVVGTFYGEGDYWENFWGLGYDGYDFVLTVTVGGNGKVSGNILVDITGGKQAKASFSASSLGYLQDVHLENWFDYGKWESSYDGPAYYCDVDIVLDGKKKSRRLYICDLGTGTYTELGEEWPKYPDLGMTMFPGADDPDHLFQAEGCMDLWTNKAYNGPLPKFAASTVTKEEWTDDGDVCKFSFNKNGSVTVTIVRANGKRDSASFTLQVRPQDDGTWFLANGDWIFPKGSISYVDFQMIPNEEGVITADDIEVTDIDVDVDDELL